MTLFIQDSTIKWANHVFGPVKNAHASMMQSNILAPMTRDQIIYFLIPLAFRINAN
jgi:hypothetical protein